MSAGQSIPITGGDLRLYPALGTRLPAPQMLEQLRAEIPWRQENITLFGRTHRQPRLICWMGDPGRAYRYSGRTWQPEPWHPLVAELRDRIGTVIGERFNAVLLNLYRDGADSMGFHADDEPELGERPVIASFSLGTERTMHFRHRHKRGLPTLRLPLPEGSLLLMRGDTQANWKHAIPKTAQAIGPRLNLTFRQILH